MKTNKIRVALIGNMNNNFFSILRYLEEIGYECTLFIFSSEQAHFNPVNDTFEIEKFKEKIIYLNFGNPYYSLLKSLNKFKITLSDYDILIGTDSAPYFMERMGLRLDVFIPHGSDTYQLPFPYHLPRNQFKDYVKDFVFQLWNLTVYPIQKKGILHARHIIMLDLIKSYSDAIVRLNVKPLRIGIPMVYTQENIIAEIPEEYAEKLKRVKENSFVIFSQSRQYWTNSRDMMHQDDMKNNHLLIKGYADFIRNNNLTPELSTLILFEYGPDVDASKKLVDELEIGKFVIWMPKMPRKYILLILKRYAKIGADQFRSGFFGGTGYEIMSQGVAFMNTINLSPEDYKSITGVEIPPVINVNTAEGIEEKLSFYYTHPEDLSAIRNKTKDWYEENLGRGLVKKYDQLIKDIITEKESEKN